jgi:polyphosphate glucokinase
LGIDVGGSGIKGAPVNCDTGELLSERIRYETPSPAKPAAVFKTIRKIIEHFDWHENIGCGFPAVIRDNVVTTASNIDKKWIGVNISNFARNEFSNCIQFINDADAAGLAEMRFGTGKDFHGLTVLVTVGTGIGSALFYGNTLIPNSELGHLILNGKIAEHFASDAVRKNEDLSWKHWSKRFNEYLKEIERLFSPDQIIIGGGMSKKTEKILKYIDINTKILPAALKNNAGIIGAALASLNADR